MSKLDAFNEELNIGDSVIILNSNGGKPYKGTIVGETKLDYYVLKDEDGMMDLKTRKSPTSLIKYLR